jgi:hypothetical protein
MAILSVEMACLAEGRITEGGSPRSKAGKDELQRMKKVMQIRYRSRTVVVLRNSSLEPACSPSFDTVNLKNNPTDACRSLPASSGDHYWSSHLA